MPDDRRLPLWKGRTLALLGILLVAWNLRSAVAALSPITAEIGRSFPLNGVGLGVLGMLPPMCFALFGLLSPLLTRRARLETVLVLACTAMLLGHLLRALAPDYLVLAAGSVIVFAGMAVGNVLLPPVVKRYFPDRVGLVTGVYATVLAVSTLLPPLVAVPVADSAGWRVSIGMWGVIALLAALPWTAIIVRGVQPLAMPHSVAMGQSIAPTTDISDDAANTGIGRATAASDGVRAAAASVTPAASTAAHRITGLSRLPLAWALAGLFGVSSLNAYAMFAWMPEILDSTAHTDPAQAGVLLSVYGGMGIPASIVIPALAARMRSVGPIIAAAFVCFLVGDLGLLLVPSAASWLWVALTGLGPLLFPLMLILINRRTRTHAGSVALSGFVQGWGYVFGSLGPLVVGILHDTSGGWLVPELFLLATAFSILVTGPLGSRHVYLEDLLAKRS